MPPRSAAYFPDFNPIEQAWSNLKQLPRSFKARLLEHLEPTLEQAIAAITPDDARAFFHHSGYVGIRQL
jgi:transposase